MDELERGIESIDLNVPKPRKRRPRNRAKAIINPDQYDRQTTDDGATVGVTRPDPAAITFPPQSDNSIPLFFNKSLGRSLDMAKFGVKASSLDHGNAQSQIGQSLLPYETLPLGSMEGATYQASQRFTPYVSAR